MFRWPHSGLCVCLLLFAEHHILHVREMKEYSNRRLLDRQEETLRARAGEGERLVRHPVTHHGIYVCTQCGKAGHNAQECDGSPPDGSPPPAKEASEAKDAGVPPTPPLPPCWLCGNLPFVIGLDVSAKVCMGLSRESVRSRMDYSLPNPEVAQQGGGDGGGVDGPAVCTASQPNMDAVPEGTGAQHPHAKKPAGSRRDSRPAFANWATCRACGPTCTSAFPGPACVDGASLADSSSEDRSGGAFPEPARADGASLADSSSKDCGGVDYGRCWESSEDEPLECMRPAASGSARATSAADKPDKPDVDAVDTGAPDTSAPDTGAPDSASLADSSKDGSEDELPAPKIGRTLLPDKYPAKGPALPAGWDCRRYVYASGRRLWLFSHPRYGETLCLAHTKRTAAEWRKLRK